MNSQRKEMQRRQIHNRKFAREMAGIRQDIQKRFAAIVKPAPKWLPDSVWYRLAAVFLNI
jgi:hypothetical protein